MGEGKDWRDLSFKLSSLKTTPLTSSLLSPYLMQTFRRSPQNITTAFRDKY